MSGAKPLSWQRRGIGSSSHIELHENFSMDPGLLSLIPLESVDFIYLDGAHDYENVKKELRPYWDRVRPGGILAGHDYCNYGEPGLSCVGCKRVPHCLPYTEFGIEHGKRRQGPSENQNGVVRAVHESLVYWGKHIRLRHTAENFTRESLAADGLDYDLVVTMTRNPSWYIIKPGGGTEGPRRSRVCGSARLEPAWGRTTSESGCLGAAPTQGFGMALALSPITSACNSGFQAAQGVVDRDGITFLLLSYASPALLLGNLERITSYPAQLRRKLHLLIVDDGSPAGLDAAAYVTAEHAVGLASLRIYRVHDHWPWNIGGARNLGFHVAPTERVLLLDADLLAPADLVIAALKLPATTKGSQNSGIPLIHRFNRRRPSGKLDPHPAAMLIGVEQYWQAGGCDEDFVGNYGATDVHFWARVRLAEKAHKMRVRAHDDLILEEVLPGEPCALPTKVSASLQTSCSNAAAALPPASRNATPNQRLLAQKLSQGCWSNSFLRFRWSLAAAWESSRIGRL